MLRVVTSQQERRQHRLRTEYLFGQYLVVLQTAEQIVGVSFDHRRFQSVEKHGLVERWAGLAEGAPQRRPGQQVWHACMARDADHSGAARRRPGEPILLARIEILRSEARIPISAEYGRNS